MTGQRTLPNLGLTNRWTPGTNGWAPGMDLNLAALDALLFLTVQSAALTTPPASPIEGARYIVPAGATGAWAGKDNQIAVELDGAWTFYTARAGWRARVSEVTSDYLFDGAAWAPEVRPYDFQIFRYRIPASPEPILSLVMGRAITFPAGLTGSRATAKTAPTVAAVDMAIMQNTTQVGTIHFAIGATVGTFSFATAVTFAIGDILEILPPTTANAAFGGLRVIIIGNR